MSTQTGRYRRHVAGADFSLEANTDATPEDGHYYVLRGGEVVLRSHNLKKAEAAYNALCREYWLMSLDSGSCAARLSGAWGLLNLEPQHAQAAAVITKDGSDQDRARLGRVLRYQHLQADEVVTGNRRARRHQE